MARSPDAPQAQPALLPERVARALECPTCGGRLGADLTCGSCGLRYQSLDGVPDLRPRGEHGHELDDWSSHWADGNQELVSQKFFSVYRRAVFARTVAHFVNTYFPDGVLVEAGCGTSETSIRIDKRGGDRLLVALDIVPAVVARAHAIMDVRICADAFRLPFQNDSIDGIWNVGVMEHFTHDRIDAMMGEFHRVLKPGAPLLLLWPGTTSIPQRMLRVAEAFIHLRGRDRAFRFHPPEISQLRSRAQGRDVLERNGFETQTIDGGLRSLFAFKTLVGRRNGSGGA